MQILIDTSVAIALRDGDARLLARQQDSKATAVLSVVTLVELEGGVGRSAAGRSQRRAAVDAMYEGVGVLNFTAREAAMYGRFVDHLGFSRPKITDRMIAATAVRAGLPLATLNPRDFRDIPGLEVEDWSL